MSRASLKALRRRLIDEFPLGPESIHGPKHWERVEKNGLALAKSTGADPLVVTLFSLFHDCRREREGHDHNHAWRGAKRALELHGELYELNPAQLETLVYACEYHTSGRTSHDLTSGDRATIGTCWDADRLELTRVGIWPDVERLSTDAAKQRLQGVPDPYGLSFEDLCNVIRTVPKDMRFALLSVAYTRFDVAVLDATYSLDKGLKLFRSSPGAKKTAWCLPDEMTLYRGVCAANEAQARERLSRLSWTPSKATAIYYAYYWIYDPTPASADPVAPYVGAIKVNRRDIEAYFPYLRHDFGPEVIVDPRGRALEVERINDPETEERVRNRVVISWAAHNAVALFSLANAAASYLLGVKRNASATECNT